VWDPRNGLNTLAATLDVYQHDEEGLQNLAVDPDFEANHWVYAYYSPPLDTPQDDPGTPVTYAVKVTDDRPVSCSKVSVAFVLGHETHARPQSSTTGCTGSIKTFLDGGHAGAANLSAVFVAPTRIRARAAHRA
jgi:hypothetical protein